MSRVVGPCIRVGRLTPMRWRHRMIIGGAIFFVRRSSAARCEHLIR